MDYHLSVFRKKPLRRSDDTGEWLPECHADACMPLVAVPGRLPIEMGPFDEPVRVNITLELPTTKN